MLSKSLIQFSVDGQGCVPSLLFDLRPNYGGVMKITAPSFKRICAHIVVSDAPDPAAGHCRPPQQMPGHSQASLVQSLVGTQRYYYFLLVHTRYCLCSPRVCFPSPVEVL